MTIAFEDALEDRNTWRVENCSIAMSMDVIGTRSSMLVLREALYGTTRFDDFVRRTKSTEAIVAARLKHLTDAGLFEKQPYKEEGKRTRYEYVLTQKGSDLMPAVFALMQWGNRYLQPDHGPLAAHRTGHRCDRRHRPSERVRQAARGGRSRDRRKRRLGQDANHLTVPGC